MYGKYTDPTNELLLSSESHYMSYSYNTESLQYTIEHFCNGSAAISIERLYSYTAGTSPDNKLSFDMSCLTIGANYSSVAECWYIL